MIMFALVLTQPSSPPSQIKTSEVEKNLAWEAQQAVKQQQSNADAASNLLSTLGGVPAGLGACRLQVGGEGCPLAS